MWGAGLYWSSGEGGRSSGQCRLSKGRDTLFFRTGDSAVGGTRARSRKREAWRGRAGSVTGAPLVSADPCAGRYPWITVKTWSASGQSGPWTPACAGVCGFSCGEEFINTLRRFGLNAPPILARRAHHVAAEILARFGQVNRAHMDPAIPCDLDLQPAIAMAVLDHLARPAYERTQAQPQDRPEHRVDPGKGIAQGFHGVEYTRGWQGGGQGVGYPRIQAMA